MPVRWADAIGESGFGQLGRKVAWRSVKMACSEGRPGCAVTVQVSDSGLMHMKRQVRWPQLTLYSDAGDQVKKIQGIRMPHIKIIALVPGSYRIVVWPYQPLTISKFMFISEFVPLVSF
jgi:hypothetical protein